jgi:hypothetical protein
MEWSAKMTPLLLQAWSGRKRSKQQHEVMGGSAGDAAENAGFLKSEGQGWEWLHMIAHSMGGITALGPQVPENLVAGTSEANSQMIVVEEWIKDAVIRSGGHATLYVGVDMFDTERHIGKRIVYDAEFYNAEAQATTVYHFEFDPLSRRQPLTIKNRSDRYSAREVQHDALPGATTHTPRSQPTAHTPYVPATEDPINELVDTALDLMRNASIESLHVFLQEAKAHGHGIPTEVFSEVGAFLPKDQLLAYLRALQGTPFSGDRAIRVVVRGHLHGKGNDDRAWVLANVLTPFYGFGAVPEPTRKLCDPLAVAEQEMEVV